MTDTPTKGHNSGDVSSVAGAQLRRFVERAERIQTEIDALNSDKKDLFAEAKSAGFNVPIIKKVITERRKAPEDKAEQDELFDLYWDEVHRG